MWDEYIKADAYVTYNYDKALEYSHPSDPSRVEFKMQVKVPRTQEIRFTPG
jgi:hypothetical protein